MDIKYTMLTAEQVKKVDKLLEELVIATANMGKDSTEKEVARYNKIQGKIFAKIEAISPEYAKIIYPDMV